MDVKSENQQPNKARDVIEEVEYNIESNPPVHICVFLGFQYYISIFVAAISTPFILSGPLCIAFEGKAMAELIGTTSVVLGLATIAQSAIGVRLPIVQATTVALLAPTLSFLNLPENECPPLVHDDGQLNLTDLEPGTVVIGTDEHREIWQEKVRLVQGSIMVASLMEILLGFTGLIGLLTRYIGPLTICPTIFFIGISLFKAAAMFASKQWVLVLNITFSQYLGWVTFPWWDYSKVQGCYRKKRGFPFFKLYPVVLSIGISWLICYILTLTDTLPSNPTKWGYLARTDIKAGNIGAAPWFRFPYPGQWGTPKVSAALVCGLFAGFLASIVESVGDYAATARVAEAPPPPAHAINRGILVEGIACFLAGAMGTANGTTSGSIAISIVGLTKTASRRVCFYAGGFFIVLGIINKFGAIFTTLPDPVIGGMFCILFGMVSSVGLSSLNTVNLNSSRNLFILAVSFFVAMTVSQWIIANPQAINTSSEIANSILYVLGSTAMFVGGMLGFILDLTIPGGSRKDRGFEDDGVKSEFDEEEQRRIYEIPCSRFCRGKFSWTRFIPICPSFSWKAKRTQDDVETQF